MANLVGVYTIGDDATLRYLPSGTPVVTLSLVFNYGQKDEKKQRPSQWVDADLYGKRAEALANSFKKGVKIYAVLEDPHIETYKKRDETAGYKLAARIESLEFVGGGNNAGKPQESGKKPASFNDYEDGEVPF